ECLDRERLRGLKTGEVLGRVHSLADTRPLRPPDRLCDTKASHQWRNHLPSPTPEAPLTHPLGLRLLPNVLVDPVLNYPLELPEREL
ncbi:Hypothetical predicted protein, partial [Pelobates cultripes]